MLSRVALRNLMGQASSAGSLETVYQTALRCVQEALEVERASLLLFGADDRMRFVAWAGLGAEYRAAVDGHSPWMAAETNATPLLVADVEKNASIAPYLDVLKREGIRALGFFPVQFGAKLLGKFMLYYREPHDFADREVEVAQQIADHVAFALEHYRIAVALEARLVSERELRRLAETEAALRRCNESRLHLALAAGRMGAWDWDINNDRLNWSPELEAIHGLEPETFEGTLDAFRRDVYPPDLKRLEDTIAAALAAPGTEYHIEYRIRRSDGTLRWLSAAGRVLVDGVGSPARMIGICRDVTDVKRAEEVRDILSDVSQVLAATLDPEDALQRLAASVVPTFADYCVTYGVDEGVVRALGFAHRDPLKEGLAEAMAHAVAASHSDGKWLGVVISRGETYFANRIVPKRTELRASPTLEPQSLMIVPLIAREHTLGAIAWVATDDSGRRFGEDDLGIARELAVRAALLVDNARHYSQARSAVSARDEMIAFVSHDLRDPMQSIAAAAATLNLAPHSRDDAESIESIVHANAQMQRLVQDLLDVSLSESGRLPLDKGPVDLKELLDEAELLYRPRVERMSLRLERALASDLPLVEIDRHRILQVLANLIGNALKFVLPGGVVTLGAERRDDRVLMWVRDTGAGIDASHLDKIFERFWSTDRRHGGGAGLGLAVAKSIVEAHGGRMNVESRPGAGSTFYFSLPVYADEARDAQDRAAASAWIARRIGRPSAMEAAP